MDHALHSEHAPERVIGALLGVRSDDGTEVEVRSTYAIPHTETEDHAEVDVEYLRTMYALHRRAYPKDVIVGWYATSPELNSLSGLMHDFLANYEGVYPHPPIHMVVPTYTEARDLSVSTYISSPVGVNPEKTRGSFLFVPIPNEIKYTEAEKSGLEAVAQAKDVPERTFSLVSDIRALELTIAEVVAMLERVSAYVANVVSGESQGSVAIGKYLLKNLALVPSVSADNLEKLFNSHLQDVLMVVYLANTVKTQLQLSSRLTPIV